MRTYSELCAYSAQVGMSYNGKVSCNRNLGSNWATRHTMAFTKSQIFHVSWVDEVADVSGEAPCSVGTRVSSTPNGAFLYYYRTLRSTVDSPM